MLRFFYFYAFACPKIGLRFGGRRYFAVTKCVKSRMYST